MLDFHINNVPQTNVSTDLYISLSAMLMQLDY